MAAAFVAGAASGNTTGTTLTLAPGTVAVGDVIVVQVMRRAAVVSLVDDLGNDYGAAVQEVGATADYDYSTYACLVTVAGIPTITLTLASSVRKGLAAHIVRGCNHPAEDSSVGGPTASAAPVAPGADSAGNCYVVGGVTKSGVSTITLGSGYSNLFSSDSVGRVGIEAKVGTVATHTPDFALGASESWFCGSVILAETAAVVVRPIGVIEIPTRRGPLKAVSYN